MVLGKQYIHNQKKKMLGEFVTDGLAHTEFSKRGLKKRLYASDAAMCPRQGALNASFVGENHYDGLFDFWVGSGNQTEETVLKGLYNSGKLLFIDYELPDVGINLGGRVDGIIFYEGRVWVLEIKEVGTIPKTRPAWKHKAQAMMYSAITGLPALIYYVNRKYSGFPQGLLDKQFELDCSYAQRFEYLRRATETHLYLKRNLIPPKPGYMKTSYCLEKRCEYHSWCWGKSGADEPNRPDFKHPTEDEVRDIYVRANGITFKLLEKETSVRRTLGVLDHIHENGSDVAKEVLSGDWSDFFLYD